MVCGEDIATLAWKVLRPRRLQAKQQSHRWPREDSRQEIQG
jgi:hypothetical protein